MSFSDIKKLGKPKGKLVLNAAWSGWGNTAYTAEALKILKKYHIFKEPQKLSIKGRVVLKVKGIEVDLTGFSEGIEFTASELEGITEVKNVKLEQEPVSLRPMEGK